MQKDTYLQSSNVAVSVIIGAPKSLPALKYTSARMRKKVKFAGAAATLIRDFWQCSESTSLEFCKHA